MTRPAGTSVSLEHKLPSVFCNVHTISHQLPLPILSLDPGYVYAAVAAVATVATIAAADMSLDPETGLDPDGVKIRASLGLESIDHFLPGYWVWSKLIQALGDIGYDSNMLVSMHCTVSPQTTAACW